MARTAHSAARRVLRALWAGLAARWDTSGGTTILKAGTGHDDYDAALHEALDRNSHRKRPQNVAIFLVCNVAAPIFLVYDCGAEYRPDLPAIHDPAAMVARVAFVDRKRVTMGHFSYQ